MTGHAHWTRPLKAGGVQFYFRTDDGQTMQGSASDPQAYRDLLGYFEAHTGCTLPEPFERPMRGGHS